MRGKIRSARRSFRRGGVGTRTSRCETGDKSSGTFSSVNVAEGVDDVVGAARRLLGVLDARLDDICSDGGGGGSFQRELLQPGHNTTHREGSYACVKARTRSV